ncbi:MAG TPA: isoprenylcysteine carboxylmethyltransferase family protein, partial [Polyangiaceae bacterium]|nr:isoprenylcysteine carboxylmethyltransferase family protein [Polyangiaceae bacterium]
RRETTGLDWDQPFAPSVGRVLTKLLGLAAALAPFALLYWWTPEYNGSFYDPLWHLLRRYALALGVATPLYLFIVDGQMRQPKDAYWQLGRVVLGRPGDARGADVANLYKTWLVKAFFFPLMFVWLSNSTHNVVTFDLSAASWSNLKAYDFLYDFIFFIDLLLATVGYAMSFRLTDSHVRTAEPTFLGWGVALFCYPPFYNLFSRQYFPYDAASFGSWLAPHPGLRWAWAIVVLLLISIYAAATLAFGVRFSNLTHRGILTNGPYRYTKHPAYVSKNISWWMVSVPFLLVDGHPYNSIKRCLALGFINFIYFARAKTEERHLSRDPVYVEYARWMNDHGALRFLNRIRLFRYVPPPLPTPESPVPAPRPCWRS